MKLSILSTLSAKTVVILSVLTAVVGGAVLSTRDAASAEPVTVMLCDGETQVTLNANGPVTPDEGREVAAKLMAEWLAKNPQAQWEKDVRERHRIVESHDNSSLVGQQSVQEGTWSTVTALDVVTWKRETEKFVAEGALVFHDGNRLGSTVAVSCDMCHPDASNTHPETYPKFQSQLGRVALLRDMINWCVEHPVRGKPLAVDGPEMRALEAYITAQRKGVPLEYGKR